jgi:hypothetical protein
LRLTKSGRIAFRGHQEFHCRMDSNIINRFGKLKSQEYDFLSELFGDMAHYFDQVIKERKPEVTVKQLPDRKRGRVWQRK